MKNCLLGRMSHLVSHYLYPDYSLWQNLLLDEDSDQAGQGLGRAKIVRESIHRNLLFLSFFSSSSNHKLVHHASLHCRGQRRSHGHHDPAASPSGSGHDWPIGGSGTSAATTAAAYATSAVAAAAFRHPLGRAHDRIRVRWSLQQPNHIYPTGKDNLDGKKNIGLQN